MSFTQAAMVGVCATLAGAVVAGAPRLSHAQTPSLRDHLLGPRSDDRRVSTPSVARFEPDAGEPFVLDRSEAKQVFLKFDASPEIWALLPTPGPRGDVIYKNDTGEAVLRATRLGGLTLFTPERPDGVAAAFMGPAPLLRPPPVFSPGALLQAFAQASDRAARAARRPVSFEAEEVPLPAVALVADTAGVVAQAFVLLAGSGEQGRRVLTRYSKVRIGVGRPSSAQAGGDTLRVTIDPDRGLAGRPSSQRVADVMAGR